MIIVMPFEHDAGAFDFGRDGYALRGSGVFRSGREAGGFGD